MAIDKDDLTSYTVRLPNWFHRRLELWSYAKATNRATLSANILQARIEANWPAIDELLNEIAESKGLTREDLEAQILKENDKD